MECRAIDDVYRLVRDKNISFIQLWFTDVLGMLKSFSIRPSELEEAMTEGMGFDGSSIEGFARLEESDMIAKPDPTTFQLAIYPESNRSLPAQLVQPGSGRLLWLLDSQAAFRLPSPKS